MARIKVTPEQLQGAAGQFQQAASDLESQENRLASIAGQLDWEVRQQAKINEKIAAVRRLAHDLGAQAGELSRFLDNKAQLFSNADQQGAAGIDRIIKEYPIPMPVPTPNPTSNEPGAPLDLKGAIDFLDEIFKPIDWIGDHAAASKQFHESMQQLGRWLNQFEGTRGYIKQLDSLSGVLEGSAKAISGLGDLLTLHDFQQYFAGQLTNQEIARSAINALVKLPIPFLGDAIAARFIPLLPDPNGKWHGLVTPVE